jgi:SecD/SecF fusion protein
MKAARACVLAVAAAALVAGCAGEAAKPAEEEAPDATGQSGRPSVIEVSTEGAALDDATAVQIAEVLTGRAKALGDENATVERVGDGFTVRLAGDHSAEALTRALESPGKLTVHPVMGLATATTPASDETLVAEDEDGVGLLLGPAALTGEIITNAEAVYDVQTYGGWAITIDFTDEGRDGWERVSGDVACMPAGEPTRRLAMILDGAVISSPQVQESVPCGVGITGGSTVITGELTGAEAAELAAVLSAGPLPTAISVESVARGS